MNEQPPSGDDRNMLQSPAELFYSTQQSVRQRMKAARDYRLSQARRPARSRKGDRLRASKGIHVGDLRRHPEKQRARRR